MAAKAGRAVKKATGKEEAPRQVAVEPGQHMVDATGFTDSKAQLRLLNQLLVSLKSLNGEQPSDTVEAVMALLTAIHPEDALEGMLAAQMIATHEHAMECLRRAMNEGQTFEGRDLNLKHATKLLQLYVRQVEALDKHRGKGQQKITVEHVTVEAGGQAIVGNVGTPAPAAARSRKVAPPVLTDERASAALDASRFETVREKVGEARSKGRGDD